MTIVPVSIPDGAALDYADGDVRHIAKGDGLNVPSLSRATRNLAYRDNLLADKLNQVIEEVNQREQIVNLPIIRTTLPPTGSLVVHNYRIPPGYEARVLSAAVSSTPQGLGKLEIFHAENFGSTSGVSLVTTLSEFPGASDSPSGTDFRPTGAFVVKLTNSGSVAVDIVGSIIVTMRAIGETAALLGAGATVARGAKGDPGPQGLVWRDAWQNGTSYVKNDGVYSSSTGNSYICRAATSSSNPDLDAGVQANGIGTYWAVLAKAGAGTPINGTNGRNGLAWKGTWSSGYGVYADSTNASGADAVTINGSSYVCKVSHSADVGKQPGTPGGAAYWDVLALRGSDGNGADTVAYKGPWSPISTYAKGSLVTHTGAGEPTRTWIANAAVSVNLEPGVSALWDELFGPSPTMTVSQASPAGSIISGVGYSAGVTSGQYLGVDLSSPATFVFSEKKLTLANGSAFANILGSGKLVFKGTARFTLPTPAAGILGVTKPWDASNTTLTATLHGKTMLEADRCQLVTVSSGVTGGTTYFDVTVNSATTENVQISIIGSEIKS